MDDSILKRRELKRQQDINCALKTIKELDPTPEFDPDLKDRWIKALRSGEFKQTSKILKSATGKGHCCLGVLCEISGLEQTVKNSREISFGYKGTDGFIAWDSKELPRPFQGSIHMDQTFQNQLAILNDSGYTFDQIATLIEIYFKRDGDTNNA